jgi:hypothetical protein
VVKLADIESVYFNTASGRKLQFDQETDQRPRSALTAALATSPRKEDAPVDSTRCACAVMCCTPVMHARSIKTSQSVLVLDIACDDLGHLGMSHSLETRQAGRVLLHCNGFLLCALSCMHVPAPSLQVRPGAACVHPFPSPSLA